MGEFSGEQGVSNNVEMGGQTDTGYDTDVADCKANDVVRYGKDSFPCFDVSQGEFYQNMQSGRQRLRFQQGSMAQKYMQGTKYNRPFYVRHTDENGKQLVRKIK